MSVLVNDAVLSYAQKIMVGTLAFTSVINLLGPAAAESHWEIFGPHWDLCPPSFASNAEKRFCAGVMELLALIMIANPHAWTRPLGCMLLLTMYCKGIAINRHLGDTFGFLIIAPAMISAALIWFDLVFLQVAKTKVE